MFYRFFLFFTLTFNLYAKDYSIEFFVNNFYKSFFNRKADVIGLNQYTNQLKSKKLSCIKIAKVFVNSTEFKHRMINKDEFIRILYQAMFQRKVDINGLNYWLNSGYSREYIFNQLLNSNEYKNICNLYGIVFKLKKKKDIKKIEITKIVLSDITTTVLSSGKVLFRINAKKSVNNVQNKKILSLLFNQEKFMLKNYYYEYGDFLIKNTKLHFNKAYKINNTVYMYNVTGKIKKNILKAKKVIYQNQKLYLKNCEYKTQNRVYRRKTLTINQF